MKRDLDLVRAILRDVEATPAGSRLNSYEYEGYDSMTVFEHIDLLIKAGYLEGEVSKTTRGPVGAAVSRITWQGHDFLDAARNDTVWKKAKEQIIGAGLPWTIDLIKQALSGYAKQELTKLGIPLS